MTFNEDRTLKNILPNECESLRDEFIHFHPNAHSFSRSDLHFHARDFASKRGVTADTIVKIIEFDKGQARIGKIADYSDLRKVRDFNKALDPLLMTMIRTINSCEGQKCSSRKIMKLIPKYFPNNHAYKKTSINTAMKRIHEEDQNEPTEISEGVEREQISFADADTDGVDCSDENDALICKMKRRRLTLCESDTDKSVSSSSLSLPLLDISSILGTFVEESLYTKSYDPLSEHESPGSTITELDWVEAWTILSE